MDAHCGHINLASNDFGRGTVVSKSLFVFNGNSLRPLNKTCEPERNFTKR